MVELGVGCVIFIFKGLTVKGEAKLGGMHVAEVPISVSLTPEPVNGKSSLPLDTGQV